jgi:HAD superfamily hydrolase (TIGR01509 family)
MRKRVGRYFDFVLAREDTPAYTGKENPLIFELALARLGCEKPSDCVFYEDSLYAIATAHNMGFHIRAVEDRWDADDRAKIEALADEIYDFGYNL